MTDNSKRPHDGRRAGLWIACLLGGAAILSTPAARADPLPWTGGQRRPTESQLAYSIPPGLKDGRCRPDMFKAAAVRGLAGRGRDLRAGRRADGGRPTIFDDTAIGTLMTAVGGKRPARGISRQDEICFSQSFEHAPDRSITAWSDRASAVHFSVIPMRTLKTSDGRFCREYAAKATINGHAADVYGTACRQPDGTWFLVD